MPLYRDDAAQTIIDPDNAAGAPELFHVSDDEPGIRRCRRGKGFTYRNPDGKTMTDEPTLKRIRSLAIPPAWTDVWICSRVGGHIQATGRDARRRKQYRYHPQFREARENEKFDNLMVFARFLPIIRKTVSIHMSLRGLPREKVLATTVYLLETTLIRVGNADYAKMNESYGLTTLHDLHVTVEGSALRFQFKGKSGKTWRLKMNDRRVAKIVKACQDLPGQELLQYLDESGRPQDITSADVNNYLREITGQSITAKDFRTWAGTVLAALALHKLETYDTDAQAKKNVRMVIEAVSSRLGNTPTICRKCYVHPEILDSYISGSLQLDIKDDLEETLDELRFEEAAVLALLHSRLSRELTPSSP